MLMTGRVKAAASLGFAIFVVRSASQQNPPFYLDYPDVDAFKVDDTYYLSASSFHMSPGAPLLCSNDLVNWEAVGASVPSLATFGPEYTLQGGSAYVKGVWASTSRYRKSNKTWYWYGCINGLHTTYVFTAPNAAGPWKQAAIIPTCFYDAGLVIDDKDNMYIAYGRGTSISVSQLSSDGLQIVNTNAKAAANFPANVGVVEGSRMYHFDGYYYLVNTKPPNANYISRSENAMGPYESRILFDRPSGPLSGGGISHQGGFVDTGDETKPRQFIAFQDSYPAGRIPVVASVIWGSDGWPKLDLPGNQWPKTIPSAGEGATRSCSGRPSGEGNGFLVTGSDTFKQSALHPSWNFNHAPDESKYSLGEQGLTLQTASVTNSLYQARNSLCRRVPGPQSEMTIAMDISKMSNGDVSGLAAFRDKSAYIGVRQDGTKRSLVSVNDLPLPESGSSSDSDGTSKANYALPSDAMTVYLRAHIDVRASGGTLLAYFSYSLDGRTFTKLGEALKLKTSYPFYLGYQFCMFNYATKALGGSVTVTRASVEVVD